MGELRARPVSDAPAVHVVVPGDVDDPARPSGGNAYDRRLCRGLRAAGLPVQEIAVAGSWPEPDDAACAELDRALAAVPAGATAVLDGLVACAVPQVLAPHARRLRLVVLVHLPLGDEAGLRRETAADRAARERACLRAAAAVVATSPWAARRLAELHGIRAHVVPPGVEPAPLATGTDAGARLLCVGSVTPTKGQDLLVEALARIADRDWTCRLVGPLTRDSTHVDAVRELIRRHGLDDRVQVAGPRTGPALDAEYAGADLLVLPSRAESYGMVVTEALARGIPVLAAEVDGVPETLGRAPDGTVPGLQVPPADVAALAAALRRWLDDPDLRAAARRAAHDRRPTLPGWDETTREWVRVLQHSCPLTAPGEAGSPVCSPDWLALREPADAAARAVELADRLRERLPEGPLVVRDLGCGTGSMGRWLAPRLPGPQHWVLHDRDPVLLDRAVGSLPPDVTGQACLGDLTGLDAADLAGTALVTASALLDLLTAGEVERLAAACTAAGCPALLALSVTGSVLLTPADPLDGAFAAAFDAHQRRTVAGRRLLGPDAAPAAAAAFRRHGAQVVRAPSPWRLGPGDGALVEEWLRGWLAAACVQQPALAAEAQPYLRRRLDAAARGELRVVVGHADLLALPGGGS